LLGVSLLENGNMAGKGFPDIMPLKKKLDDG
jgi:hypothetical protein